ncbi:MAG: branched-chain amino acid ABC transporter permease, partial [Stellaceae bacterium]
MSDVVVSTVSILFFGIAYGMVLYLVSVGLSVTMGLMGFVNLAHGVFAAAGGYVATSLMNRLGLPFLPAVLGGVVAAMMLSVPLERLLYRRLYGGDELDQVLLTIGLAFMAVAAGKFIWGPLAQPFQPPDWLSGHIDVAGRQFPTFRSFVIVAGVALFAALWLGLERTKFGAMIRAAVDNRRMAQSVGINTSELFTWTFALGSGLAALGGSLGAEILAIEPAYALEH